MRQLVSHLSRKLSMTKNCPRPKIMILGTGWGGYSVLQNINQSMYDLVVISPRNHFLFTPLLCSTTVGTLEFRSIIQPVRKSTYQNAYEFYLAKAISLDLINQNVSCQSILNPDLKYELKYDKLVIAVGANNNTFGVPGVEEHAFFLKEVADARRIRNKIIDNFELALQPNISDEKRKQLLHTVIVGGGPTGVEFGAELYDFVEQDVSRLYKQGKDLVRVTLVESNRILSSFDRKLQSYAEKKIKERDRFSLVKSSVIEVTPDSVTLEDETKFHCGLVVWSTGLSPRTFIKSLDVPKNKAGQILTDKYLKVLGDPGGNTYALGDCADIDGLPLPATAQVAERQGRYLAKTLSRRSKNAAEPFHFKSMGMLAYIGGYKALTDLPELKLQGITSWLLWRSAYLTRLGSWRLRMQVPMDWLKTLLFGRDVSRF